MKAVFKHKCRRCDSVINEGETSIRNAYQFLSEVIVKGYSDCNGTIPLMLISMHECVDGGVGVTDLIGFRKEEG